MSYWGFRGADLVLRQAGVSLQYGVPPCGKTQHTCLSCGYGLSVSLCESTRRVAEHVVIMLLETLLYKEEVSVWLVSRALRVSITGSIDSIPGCGHCGDCSSCNSPQICRQIRARTAVAKSYIAAGASSMLKLVSAFRSICSIHGRLPLTENLIWKLDHGAHKC